MLMTAPPLLACSGLVDAIEEMEPEPVPPDKADYVGTWRSDDGVVTLTIQADGFLTHTKSQGMSNSEFNAPIKAFEDDAIIAGIGPAVQTFKIDKPPKKVKGDWRMMVNDIALTRD